MRATFIATTCFAGRYFYTPIEVDSAPDDTILTLFVAMYNQMFGLLGYDEMDSEMDSETFFSLGGILTEETAVLNEGCTVYRLTVWELATHMHMTGNDVRFGAV